MIAKPPEYSDVWLSVELYVLNTIIAIHFLSSTSETV